jgi:general secretion pathway protein C
MKGRVVANFGKLLGSGYLPAGANLLLVILLAYSAAELTWQLVPQSTHESTDTAQNLAPPSTNTAIPEDLSTAIVEQHLFGRAQSQLQASQKAVQDAPETRLNLSLTGVLAYNTPQAAMAIISEGAREEEIYGVGDTLPGNAVLQEVYPDRVILKRGARFETLRLPEETTGVQIQASQPAETFDPEATARQLRDQILQNPASFAQRVATVPVREGGRLIGYRLLPKEGDTVLEQLGLLPDDVITEVNGTRLENPQQSLRALRKLASAKNIELTLLRDEVEMPMTLSLE